LTGVKFYVSDRKTSNLTPINDKSVS
jgi:hypothetical protein